MKSDIPSLEFFDVVCFISGKKFIFGKQNLVIGIGLERKENIAKFSTFFWVFHGISI